MPVSLSLYPSCLSDYLSVYLTGVCHSISDFLCHFNPSVYDYVYPVQSIYILLRQSVCLLSLSISVSRSVRVWHWIPVVYYQAYAKHWDSNTGNGARVPQHMCQFTEDKAKFWGCDGWEGREARCRN